MDDLTDIIIKYRWEIAGALAMAFIIAYLAGLNSRKDRYAKAAIAFQNLVRTELRGIYPSIELYLPADEINDKIRQSIPGIQLAVSNFESFVPFYRKRGFDVAAQKYYETARKTDWNEIRAQQRFPVTYPGPSKIEMAFTHCVENLLSYAKEK